MTRQAQILDDAAVLAGTFFPVLQALPWPAALLDESGTVVCVNRHMDALAPVAMHGRRLAETFSEYCAVLRTDPPWQSQETVVTRHSNGHTVHERLWLRSTPAGAVLIVVDETRLHRLETERAQTVRLASLGFMLAGVSHEISNPLAVIHSMLQLLKGQALQDPLMLEKGLDSISVNVARILEISRRLNGFARANGERQRPCSIDGVLEEAIALVRHEPSLGDVRIEHRRDGNAVVWCNANEMQQVFSNLLANAIQAMEGCGRIRIATRRTGEHVEVTLQDDGPGIRPEHIGRIFEPFFSTKLAGHGTGLGLAICNEIVREHGGTLRAESSYGEGARFYVKLPLWGRK